MTSENTITFIKQLDQFRILLLALELAYTDGDQDQYVDYLDMIGRQLKTFPKSVEGVTPIQDIVGV